MMSNFKIDSEIDGRLRVRFDNMLLQMNKQLF